MKQRNTGKVQFQEIFTSTGKVSISGEGLNTPEATGIYQFITNNQALFHLCWKGNLLNHQNVPNYYEHDCSFLFRKFLLCYGGEGFIYDQKYRIAFSSNTYLFFVVASKIAGFSISFYSLFSILFHTFGALIVILYLHYISLKEDTI